MLFGVAFSPDGRLIAFSGWDCYGNVNGQVPTPVEIWDVQRGKRVQTLNVDGVALHVAFTAQSTHLVVSGPTVKAAALGREKRGAHSRVGGTGRCELHHGRKADGHRRTGGGNRA